MIEYPLKTLTDAGIKDIIIVTGGNYAGQFLDYLKNGKEFNCDSISYAYQEGAGGLSDALNYASPLMNNNESCVVLLGDNYFEEGISNHVERWKSFMETGAMCLLKQVDTPWDFGIAEVRNKRISSLEEKPAKPKSDLAVIGGYFFDSNVWNYLKTIKVSKRGEKEITDLLKIYMNKKSLYHDTYNGYWKDMGTFKSWSEVSHRVKNRTI